MLHILYSLAETLKQSKLLVKYFARSNRLRQPIWFYSKRKTKSTQGSFIQELRKIFRKTNISYPLIRTLTCAYQRTRNISFPEHFAQVLNQSFPTRNGDLTRNSPQKLEKPLMIYPQPTNMFKVKNNYTKIPSSLYPSNKYMVKFNAAIRT